MCHSEPPSDILLSHVLLSVGFDDVLFILSRELWSSSCSILSAWNCLLHRLLLDALLCLACRISEELVNSAVLVCLLVDAGLLDVGMHGSDFFDSAVDVPSNCGPSRTP